ncbi:MAG: MotA/TolQ/ExbB proton channel family protein [Planctomycetia bacterium]|nr:MotA/TolQ/ExbB proton channel family protein [Planctomycetia bacterium]
MNDNSMFDRAQALARFVAWHAVFAIAIWCVAARTSHAQDAQPVDAERLAEEKLAAPTASEDTAAAEPAAAFQQPAFPSLLEMFFAGGILMWPILFMSFVVVIFGCERLIALRRRRVIPPRLVRQLIEQSSKTGGLDPKAAYRLCQQYPSAAASVLKEILLKLGRPHSEVEAIKKDVADREANRLFNNVRPINLAASVAPLLGLLGTVQGMIMAFFVTANLPAGQNKTQFLAQGIYIALVTTFAGLTVAIPAVMTAHFFEGRIQRLFTEIDEFLLGLLPHLERFEGKQRVTPGDLEREKPAAVRRPVESPMLAVPAAKE